MNAFLSRNKFGGLLLAACVLLVTNLGGRAAAVDWPQLSFTQIASGLSGPTSIAFPPDGSGRIFVTEQSGRVMLIQSNSVTPFLDLQDQVLYTPGTGLGLLSIAFPPGFATNQYFYVYYNSATISGDSTVSRFYVSSTNADVGDASTEQILLQVADGDENSLSGGLLLFGPEGYLYVGMGDSGFFQFAPNKAQNKMSLKGKILRLDVESSLDGYQIPNDNPFVGNADYLPEIWALGLRNPWRFSFDRMNGDFYVGDVGQLESEEVDFKAGTNTAAQNYGWPIREGFHLYTGPDLVFGLTDPIAEILHTGPPGSVTGGFVYRGPGPTRMTGLYLYAEAYSGNIFALVRNGTNWVNQVVAHVPYFITAFGEDEVGQLYLADYISGKIFRMEDNGAVAAPTFNPPGTNSFTATIAISCLSTGAVIHYTTTGIDPVESDPSVSSGGGVTVAAGTVLKARAYRNDLLPSPVNSVFYNLKTARPTFSPSLTSATNGQPISLSCVTPGATIRFTIDGSDPTSASAAYIAPLTYTNGVTFKARGFKSGFTDSATAVFPSSPLVIQNFTHFQSSFLANSFSYQSSADWIFQVQIAEDPADWRNLGGTQKGTNGVVNYLNQNFYPLPIRRLFRLAASPDLGL